MKNACSPHFYMLTLSLRKKIQKRYSMKGDDVVKPQNKAWQLNSKIILALMVGQVVDEEGEEGETPIRKEKMAGVMLFYLRKKDLQ